jgi:spore coat polysaccharide biosynthesis protein SpsF
MINVTASIQARMGSTRLPGKVLNDICGKPMLLWQVERLKRCRLVDRVVVATSNNPNDNEIEDFCKNNKIDCFRGSENNVLGRIASLVRDLRVELHVECYGDSPLIDPQIVDEFIGFYLKWHPKFDYLSSALKTTYPPGFEVTLYDGGVLLETDDLVTLEDPMREHAGYNISRFPEKFLQYSMEAQAWYHHPNIYLEVDTLEDLEFIRNVVGYFVNRGQSHFSLAEILTMLGDNPDLTKGNETVERRWKALRMPNVL